MKKCWYWYGRCRQTHQPHLLVNHDTWRDNNSTYLLDHYVAVPSWTDEIDVEREAYITSDGNERPLWKDWPHSRTRANARLSGALKCNVSFVAASSRSQIGTVLDWIFRSSVTYKSPARTSVLHVVWRGLI
jgi:hypothetical protein